jgi:putative membrane protein
MLCLILTGLIALQHCGFAYVEMLAWEDLGPKLFRSFPPDLFAPTLDMAANQGLYNLFLVAGLIWALLIRSPQWQRNVAVFFLLCVVVAGAFGAMTVSTTIFWVQGLPAVIALALWFFSRPETQS